MGKVWKKCRFQRIEKLHWDVVTGMLRQEMMLISEGGKALP